MIRKTDSDYNEKVQKFIDCRKTIDTDKCPKDCDKCKFRIEVIDFIYLLIHGSDDD